MYWSERSACTVRRQNNEAKIFFSLKRLKKIGPSKVHAPKEQLRSEEAKKIGQIEVHAPEEQQAKLCSAKLVQ